MNFAFAGLEQVTGPLLGLGERLKAELFPYCVKLPVRKVHIEYFRQFAQFAPQVPDDILIAYRMICAPMFKRHAHLRRKLPLCVT